MGQSLDLITLWYVRTIIPNVWQRVWCFVIENNSFCMSTFTRSSLMISLKRIFLKITYQKKRECLLGKNKFQCPCLDLWIMDGTTLRNRRCGGFWTFGWGWIKILGVERLYALNYHFGHKKLHIHKENPTLPPPKIRKEYRDVKWLKILSSCIGFSNKQCVIIRPISIFKGLVIA